MVEAPEPRSHVLVVDDQPRNRALLRALLGELHDITEAASGTEAIEIVNRDPTIDLVLLDVMMPGLDGFAVCRQIKEGRVDTFLPVLMLTALSDQHSRNAGFEAGADDFVTKPFDRKELLLRTRAFLRLRHQDERIRSQLEELRRLDLLKDNLAALLVHDLRNPLAGLSGLLAMMHDDPAGADTPEMIDEALTASRHLRETIEDMVQVRALEDQQLTPHRAPVRLRALCADALASLDGDARARGLVVELTGGDAVVDIDGSLVRRAVENLVANALRYTRPRTTVTLDIAVDDATIDLMVADRGPGVPEAFKDRVFEKYGSVEGGGRAARRGCGLGLYLVKLASEAHGGRATVEDREGGGAEFHIRLPRSPP